jgi:hypothetical protein
MREEWPVYEAVLCFVETGTRGGEEVAGASAYDSSVYFDGEVGAGVFTFTVYW